MPNDTKPKPEQLDANGRPKVGPADDETRRKLLREKLDEPSKAEGAVQREKPKPKKKRSAAQELSDALDPNVKRERTLEGKSETVDTMADAIERGVKEAKDSTED